ncbi:hypothetical protein GDO86_014607 [Hymenochirus boettgeri]|uniref:Uncharacterized protein n=1 Tax=Hymenochirus boettgeri TaxID=247094 RepID=A0A8T2JXQ1_9PIPI|nr:hypothetical protein GDO86_014607 [Hymenochirus boettgeri]
MGDPCREKMDPNKHTEGAVECHQPCKRTQKKKYPQKSLQVGLQKPVDPEQQKMTEVVGQLKAAEARDRLRLTRLRSQYIQVKEQNYLIACQPTAQDAIRLEALLAPRPQPALRQDPLNRRQRERVEKLLSENTGILN